MTTLFLLMDENRYCNNDIVMTATGLREFCEDLALPEDKERLNNPDLIEWEEVYPIIKDIVEGLNYSIREFEDSIPMESYIELLMNEYSDRIPNIIKEEF